jgi:predicted alpha-1,2-mannosidase
MTQVTKYTWAWMLLVIAFCAPRMKGQRARDAVDYVSPNIGGIGQLLTATVPYVQYPHGMARLAPITTPGIMDRYLADKIYGFPVGPAMLMASVGNSRSRPQDYASDFDHDFETATPYYYEADLQTWNVKAESTVSAQAAYYRFTFPANAHAHLALSMKEDADFTVIGNNVIQGSERIVGPVGELTGSAGETREYFYLECSKPFSGYSTWQGGSLSHVNNRSGDSIGVVTDVATHDGEQIEARIGISYISVEQARRNLERDIPSWNFTQVETNARTVWNKALSTIDVVGGTEKQRTIFYTALYHSLGRMTDITEDGKYFSGYDHAVHNAEGHDFYIDDGIWDTYRSLHPLQLLLNAGQQEDMIRSYLRMYEQSGWLPSFPSVAGDQEVMIGHHAASLIADAYAKAIVILISIWHIRPCGKMRRKRRCFRGDADRLPVSIRCISRKGFSRRLPKEKTKPFRRSQGSGGRPSPLRWKAPMTIGVLPSWQRGWANNQMPITS